MAPKWNSIRNGLLQGFSSINDLDLGHAAHPIGYQACYTPKDAPKPENIVFGHANPLFLVYTISDKLMIDHIMPDSILKVAAPAYSMRQISLRERRLLNPSILPKVRRHLGPDDKPRLFRPQKNMERLSRSAARVALPPFNESAVLTLIKKLVVLEKRWIPAVRGYSLYIRPTMIGIRAALGVAASDHAMLCNICSPTGPYFPTPKTINLLAISETVRSWPGGTGGHKLGLDYSPGFTVLRNAVEDGYDHWQILWLLPDGKEMKFTEAGAMNFFVAVNRDDDGLDITPPLDGTILPGVTLFPNIDPSKILYVHERPFTADLILWSAQGKLLEAFGVGTAVVVVGLIGFQGQDIRLPSHKSVSGPVGHTLQEGRVEWDNWSVVCE